MKKLKAIAALCGVLLAANQSQAQVITKGSIVAGLNVSGQNTNNIDSFGAFSRGRAQLNFAPYVSYAFAKNQTVGTYMLLNNVDGSNFNFGKNKHDFAVGLFTRRYFALGKKLYAYGQIDFQYASASTTSSIARFSNKSFNINLSAGIGYKISNRLLLELGINNLATANFGSYRTYPNGSPSIGYKMNELLFRGPVERNGLHIGLSYRFK
jgi:hypothetical protein